MPPHDEHLAEIAQAILRYLEHNPQAADTIEGIAKWWLPAEWCVDARTVQSALYELEVQGKVHRRIHADRHVLYSR